MILWRTRKLSFNYHQIPTLPVLHSLVLLGSVLSTTLFHLLDALVCATEQMRVFDDNLGIIFIISP